MALQIKSVKNKNSECEPAMERRWSKLLTSAALVISFGITNPNFDQEINLIGDSLGNEQETLNAEMFKRPTHQKVTSNGMHGRLQTTGKDEDRTRHQNVTGRLERLKNRIKCKTALNKKETGEVVNTDLESSEEKQAQSVFELIQLNPEYNNIRCESEADVISSFNQSLVHLEKLRDEEQQITSQYLNFWVQKRHREKNGERESEENNKVMEDLKQKQDAIRTEIQKLEEKEIAMKTEREEKRTAMDAEERTPKKNRSQWFKNFWKNCFQPCVPRRTRKALMPVPSPRVS